MNKIILLTGFILFFCSANCFSADNLKVRWKISTIKKQWVDMPEISLSRDLSGTADAQIKLNSQKQEIDGFGGAFNEKGWAALSVLDPEERDDVMKSLFDPQGAKFNICRVPIGSSDYAVSRYTLDETKNDYEMKDFSIERDKRYLIPYIKAAMKFNPDLQLWGSAWTPPTWMKKNGSFDAGEMKDDPKIYEAYADYLIHFIQAYQKEGINIFAVAVQNEPLIDRNYPSCLWTPDQFLVFIRDYMGPAFAKKNLGDRIMLGTLQDGNYYLYPHKVLSDPRAERYVSYIGYQWDGLRSVAATRKNFPAKKILQTETECGNWYWKTDFQFNPDYPQNDWYYGTYTWSKVKNYFDEGVNSYLLWNMILDEEGKSIDSKNPWPQDSAIVVNKNTKQVVYTPMFFAFKHFSYFIKPGAHYLDIRGNENIIAFLNPGGETVIVLQNKTQNANTIRINIESFRIQAELPGMSWSTLIVPKLN